VGEAEGGVAERGDVAVAVAANGLDLEAVSVRELYGFPEGGDVDEGCVGGVSWLGWTGSPGGGAVRREREGAGGVGKGGGDGYGCVGVGESALERASKRCCLGCVGVD